MSKIVYGVDIGGTTIKIGAFTVDGTLLEKWEIPTRKEEQGTLIIPDVTASVRAHMEKNGYTEADVAGMGVGAPGPVGADGTIYQAVNLGWGKFNLAKAFEQVLGLPVKAGNDANVAALGEMWQGGGQGYKDMVMVTLGTGVGGGIIVNGRLVAGHSGCGGEIGHIKVEDQNPIPCNCGGYGCLERYTSATGVVALAEKILAESDEPSMLREGTLTCKLVWDGVKASDAIALKVADQFGYYLGKGLAAIAAIVNPEIFVIGGGVSKAGEILFDYAKPYFKDFTFAACKETKFVLAKLGNDAGIYGAAQLVIMED